MLGDTLWWRRLPAGWIRNQKKIDEKLQWKFFFSVRYFFQFGSLHCGEELNILQQNSDLAMYVTNYEHDWGD